VDARDTLPIDKLHQMMVEGNRSDGPTELAGFFKSHFCNELETLLLE
jgi:hypothetical protein